MREQRISIPMLLRILATLALIAFALGVIGDMRARFEPALRAGTEFPRTLAVAVVALLMFLGLILTQVWFSRFYQPFLHWRDKLGWLGIIVAILLATFISWFFLYTIWSEVFSGFYLRLLLYLLILWMISWLLTRSSEQVIGWNGLLAGVVLLGGIFTFVQASTGVTDYPFGLSWSEGNRLWDYSVLYGRHLYDYPLNKPIPAYIDLGRQSLWGLPFLLPGVTIAAARLWSAFLFTIPYALLGMFIFRSLKSRPALWLLAGLWSMLFLNQGPIYTPLVLIAILAAATRPMPLWLGSLFVMLASYYAVNTRVTWMFSAGIWAALIAFIEADPRGVRTTLQRWRRAIVLGLSGLIGSNLIPLAVRLAASYRSGTVVKTTTVIETAVGAVGRQPLLWDRLLPNPTYPPGILLGLLMAAGPLAALLLICGSRSWKLSLWQKLAVWGSMLAFLGVGLVVSVKIGGGSNLHNLDMFLITLLILAGLAWEAGVFSWILMPQRRTWLLHLILLLVVLIPASNGMMSAAPRNLPGPEKVQPALDAIREALQDTNADDEVLFIDQRQLLTFGLVPSVKLVPEYEKKRMMDEAMAENAAYFAPFYRDLYNHRFALIISEPLWIKFQGETYQFGNENDAWVKWVSIPVLCYYQPVETFLDVGIQLLVPRKDAFSETEIPCPVP